MSIRRTNIDRINEALKSSKLTIGKGVPSKSEGSEGDLTFRRTSDGFKLFIKANNIWHSIKAGESFDKLEKIVNDLKSKVDKIKPLNHQVLEAGKGFKVGNTTITTSEYDVSSGNLTVDVAGDIVLSADGDNITMDNGTTTTFDFNTNTSVLKIMDTANTDDYCTITVEAEGATTIATNDDDTAIGHLSLIPDGDLILDPVSHRIKVLDNTVGFTQTEPTFDATDTIVDFSITGNKQKLTLTNNVTDVHFRFPAMSGNFICVILQDGSGSRTVSNWKSNSSDGTERTLLWAGGTAPVNTEIADKADIASFYWDADNNIAYGVYTYNF